MLQKYNDKTSKGNIVSLLFFVMCLLSKYLLFLCVYSQNICYFYEVMNRLT